MDNTIAAWDVKLAIDSKTECYGEERRRGIRKLKVWGMCGD
jgi:hypothetical protein